MNKWINRTWHIQSVEYYSALKRKDMLMCVWTLKIVMLSEVSQTPKYKKCTILPGIVQFMDAANGMVIVRSWGKRVWESCLVGTEFQCGMKKFWRWCWWWLHNGVNVLKDTDLYTNVITMVNFMLRIFYHNKKSKLALFISSLSFFYPDLLYYILYPSNCSLTLQCLLKFLNFHIIPILDFFVVLHSDLGVSFVLFCFCSWTITIYYFYSYLSDFFLWKTFADLLLNLSLGFCVFYKFLLSMHFPLLKLP